MKRYLKALMPILTFLAIVFILSNSFSDGNDASAKRDFVLKMVTGEKSFAQKMLATVAKSFHMMEYAFFSFCLTSSVFLLGDLKSARFERVLLCGMLLAVTDELIQSMFSGRGSKVTDIVVDTAGIIVGYAVSVFLAYLVKKKNEKKKGT